MRRWYYMQIAIDKNNEIYELSSVEINKTDNEVIKNGVN